jgi:site-specific recombinase XerD/DNA-binding CsgD family transcriptional regulator
VDPSADYLSYPGDAPKGHVVTPQSHQSERPGRHPLLDTPSVAITPLWSEAWVGFELCMLSEGKSVHTMRNARSQVTIMAWHATAESLEPGGITKLWLQSYLVRQFDGRKGAGAATMYQHLRQFWSWYEGEYGTPSPMSGIPRPKGTPAVPPVLGPDALRAIFKACAGSTPKETARNQAIVWLLLESGLRRFELSALDTDDIDLSGKTVTVRRGKNGKARVAVFGDDTRKALWQWLRRRGATPGALFLSRVGDRAYPQRREPAPGPHRAPGGYPVAAPSLPAFLGAPPAIRRDQRARPHDPGRVVISEDAVGLRRGHGPGASAGSRPGSPGREPDKAIYRRCHIYGLSPREREVAVAVVAGLDTRAVTERLFISRHTVQDHLKSVFEKMSIHSRREMLAMFNAPQDG